MRRISICQKTGLKRGAWTPEEDRVLAAYITRYGHWNWRQIPKFAGLSRCGKSCRLRWMNYLRPNIKIGHYSKDEDELIIRMHQKLGNRWSAIAACLPGRTDNEIKNHWHTRLRKCTEQAAVSDGASQKLKKFETPRKREQVHKSCETIFPATVILESSPVLLPSGPNSSENSLSCNNFDAVINQNLIRDESTLSQDSSALDLAESFLNDSFLVEGMYLPEHPSTLFSPPPVAESLYPYDMFDGYDLDIFS